MVVRNVWVRVLVVVGLLLAASVGVAQSLFDVVRNAANLIEVDHLLPPLEVVALPARSFKLIDPACDLVVERFGTITGADPAGEGQAHGITCYFVPGGSSTDAGFAEALRQAISAAGFDLERDDDVAELRLRREGWHGASFSFVVIYDTHLAPDLIVLIRPREEPSP